MNGIIIKVKDMEESRDFYRNVLDLGNPVVDSNFWIEFKLGNFSLVLELFSKYESREQFSNVLFFYEVEKLSVFEKRLKQTGYGGFSLEQNKLGIKLLKCKDPDGNVFAVRERE